MSVSPVELDLSHLNITHKQFKLGIVYLIAFQVIKFIISYYKVNLIQSKQCYHTMSLLLGYFLIGQRKRGIKGIIFAKCENDNL